MIKTGVPSGDPAIKTAVSRMPATLAFKFLPLLLDRKRNGTER